MTRHVKLAQARWIATKPHGLDPKFGKAQVEPEP